MAIFTAGLIGIIVFYILILAVGLWASRKARDNSEEEMMLAGRSLGYMIGGLTLIATWVGGGYISGAAEAMFSQGLAWVQVPIGYSFALFIGALLFVEPMRNMEYVTLLDPFQKRYGNRVGSILFVPTVFGDIFWVASILSALGSALMVITGLSQLISIVISAVFVAMYTSIGAMYSVTYTDVFQMFFILFGLILSIPFIALSKYVDHDKLRKTNWLGEIKPIESGEWMDTMLLLILGGIPWQGYMQRILAIKTTVAAKRLSMIATICCACMSIPSAYIGIVARGINWEEIPTFRNNITTENATIILPLVLRHVTHPAVAFFGLGAISAAVMSSADSSVLAFSAVVSRNMYKNLIRPTARDREISWVLRITVVIMATVASVIGITVSSVYYLSVLSSDLIYVILFPQLLLVIYWWNHVNSYGCILSFLVGLIFRVLSGEKALGLPAVIRYPWYDEVLSRQRFPHRTATMLISLFTHMIVSEITNCLFKKKILREKYDILKFFKTRPEEAEEVTLENSVPARTEKKKKKKTDASAEEEEKTQPIEGKVNTKQKVVKEVMESEPFPYETTGNKLIEEDFMIARLRGITRESS